MDQHGLPRYHNFLLSSLIYHSKENLVGPIYAEKLDESDCLYEHIAPTKIIDNPQDTNKYSVIK